MLQPKNNAPFTISDRHNELVRQVDALQRKIGMEDKVLAKTFYNREVEERQAEMKKLMDTMVEKGDLEYLPWIKRGEVKPVIKNLHLNA